MSWHLAYQFFILNCHFHLVISVDQHMQKYLVWACISFQTGSIDEQYYYRLLLFLCFSELKKSDFEWVSLFSNTACLYMFQYMSRLEQIDDLCNRCYENVEFHDTSGNSTIVLGHCYYCHEYWKLFNCRWSLLLKWWMLKVVQLSLVIVNRVMNAESLTIVHGHCYYDGKLSMLL